MNPISHLHLTLSTLNFEIIKLNKDKSDISPQLYTQHFTPGDHKVQVKDKDKSDISP